MSNGAHSILCWWFGLECMKSGSFVWAVDCWMKCKKKKKSAGFIQWKNTSFTGDVETWTAVDELFRQWTAFPADVDVSEMMFLCKTGSEKSYQWQGTQPMAEVCTHCRACLKAVFTYIYIYYMHVCYVLFCFVSGGRVFHKKCNNVFILLPSLPRSLPLSPPLSPSLSPALSLPCSLPLSPPLSPSLSPALSLSLLDLFLSLFISWRGFFWSCTCPTILMFC